MAPPRADCGDISGPRPSDRRARGPPHSQAAILQRRLFSDYHRYCGLVTKCHQRRDPSLFTGRRRALCWRHSTPPIKPLKTGGVLGSTSTLRPTRGQDVSTLALRVAPGRSHPIPGPNSAGSLRGSENVSTWKRDVLAGFSGLSGNVTSPRQCAVSFPVSPYVVAGGQNVTSPSAGPGRPTTTRTETEPLGFSGR